MESVQKSALRKIYTVAVELLRIKTNENDDVDVPLDLRRDQIIKELEKVQTTIDKVVLKDYDNAINELKGAINHAHGFDFVAARPCFLRCYRSTNTGFSLVLGFEDKMLIAKIQILCIMNIMYFFVDGPNGEKNNLNLLQSEIRTIFIGLSQSAIVQFSVREEFEPKPRKFRVMSSMPQKERQEVLLLMHELQEFCAENLGISYPIEKSDKSPVDWCDMKPVVFHSEAKILPSQVHAMTSKGKKIYLARNRNIEVWCTRTGALLCTLFGHERNVNCLLIVDNILYSGSSDLTISIWDLTTHSKIGRLPGNDDIVTLSCQDQTLYAGTLSSGETIVWDLNTYSQIERISPKMRMDFLCVRENIFFGIVGAPLLLWSRGEGKVLYQMSNHCTCALIDGSRLYCTAGTMITVWELTTNTIVLRMLGHSETISHMLIDRGKLYSSSSDGTIRIWDTRDGDQVGCITTKEKDVSMMCVAGSRLYYVSAAAEGVKMTCL